MNDHPADQRMWRRTRRALTLPIILSIPAFILLPNSFFLGSPIDRPLLLVIGVGLAFLLISFEIFRAVVVRRSRREHGQALDDQFLRRLAERSRAPHSSHAPPPTQSFKQNREPED